MRRDRHEVKFCSRASALRSHQHLFLKLVIKGVGQKP